MTRLVCLANSKRPHGRCVAGIDLDTGRWLRPVPVEHDAVPEERLWLSGTFLAPLDVIELELAPISPTPRFQRENHVVRDWNWARRGRLKATELLRYVEEHAPIFHGSEDRVPPYVLDFLPPAEWKSLQLVRPRGLTLERDPAGPHRWRARFRDRDNHKYCFRVTDPVITRRMESGEKIADDCLLTIALTKPYIPPDTTAAPRCYKLVAAVIELAFG
ncbi:MAG TPA: hypothetical protein VNH11_11230 [Pirellulales bacterium]|nr:hypothetical protein [Pirellulales bacterium]